MNQRLAAGSANETPVDILGKSADARRFLLTLLLTTSYHLASRPISFANDSFFQTLAVYSDKILDALREEGWDPLDPIIEEGISCLEPIAGWAKGRTNQKEMAQRFGHNFRRYFRELNVPWSALPPVDQKTVDDWEKPQHILLTVGPNIGIGDEMIFFRAMERLSRRYPEAHLEVSTFHSSLWNLCDVVNEISPNSDSLAPYARAKALLTRDPRALVLFVEFASAPIYRQLEQVPGFSRFIYLDTGAQLVRMVDQRAPSIFEYKSRASHSVYEVLDDLLAHIGLERVNNSLARAGSRIKTEARRNVFLNTFTSKDTSEVNPEWWAQILNAAGRVTPLHVEIFAGINENTQAYSKAIQKSLHSTACTSSQFGSDCVPTIGDTLKRAMACDAILGIDTFTGHVGNLKSVPSITVFLSSSWHAWRVPDPAVLNVSVHDDPERIGNLLARLLVRPANDSFVNVAVELNREVERIRRMLSFPDIAGLLPALRRCIVLSHRLSEMDAELERSFNDLPPSFLDPLLRILSSVDTPTEALRRLLAEAWQLWENSNFSRYLRALSMEEHA